MFIIYLSQFISEDNNSTHTAKSIREWIVQNGKSDKIMKTPDLNPIENVWASMKYYPKTVAKPMDELVPRHKTVCSMHRSHTASYPSMF